MRRPYARSRPSFLTRVFLVNALMLAVITLLLLFSPVEINAPVTGSEAAILVAGFVLSLAVNLLLLRRAAAPLRRLTAVMRTVEPLEPGRRVVVPGADAEVERLAVAFNDMLDRLESERRESGRRAAAAQEEERLRVSRELHDEVGQVLTGVMLSLDDPKAREAVRRSLEDVRRIARELRPEALDELGLHSALRSLCIAATATGALRVRPELDLGANVELNREVELAIYRVAQEGITNVLRHARATDAVVAMHEVDSSLRLVVSDNGRGLPLEGPRQGGGIAGMRERAMHIGGRFMIEPLPDGGTELRLDVPLPDGLA